MSQRAPFALGIVLIAILSVSIVATIDWLGSVNSNSEFFVGVEFAYSGNISDLKDLVDKVKSYTNLFVIGSLEITFNQTALDEVCDYVVDSGLHLIVFLQIVRVRCTVIQSLIGWLKRSRSTVTGS